MIDRNQWCMLWYNLVSHPINISSSYLQNSSFYCVWKLVSFLSSLYSKTWLSSGQWDISRRSEIEVVYRMRRSLKSEQIAEMSSFRVSLSLFSVFRTLEILWWLEIQQSFLTIKCHYGCTVIVRMKKQIIGTVLGFPPLDLCERKIHFFFLFNLWLI